MQIPEIIEQNPSLAIRLSERAANLSYEVKPDREGERDRRHPNDGLGPRLVNGLFRRKEHRERFRT